MNHPDDVEIEMKSPKAIMTLMLLLAVTIFHTGVLAASLRKDPEKRGNGHWDGNFTLVGGSNFNKEEDTFKTWSNEQIAGNASISYNAGKYFTKITARADFIQNFRNSSVITRENNSKDTIPLGAESRLITERINSNGIGVSTGYLPNKHDEFRFDFNYGSRYNNSSIFSGSLYLVDGWTMKQEDLHYSYRSYDGRLSYVHRIDADREFYSSAGMGVVTDDNCSDWDFMEFLPSYTKWRYDSMLLIPYRYLYDYNGMVKYSEKNIFGADNLNMDFTLGLDYKNNKDYQRAINAAGNMTKNDFIYKEIKISPKFHMSYEKNRNIIDLSYTPEFYARRIDSGDSIGNFDNIYVSHLIDLNYTVVVKEHHKLSLYTNRTISRPNYLQVLWFPRTGTDNYKEVYQGNRDLVPAKIYTGRLSYTYSDKGLTLSPSVLYRYGFKVIEESFFTQQQGDDLYNIHTWVNGGEDHTVSGIFNAEYELKKFKIGFSGTINYYHSVRTNSSKVYSTDYSLAGNISYEYKGWKGTAVAGYRSKVERSYVSRTEIVDLDIRVEKKLGRFTVFAIADNLLDRPVYITTLSSNGANRKEEQQRNYLTCYKLGVSFTFHTRK